MEQKTKECPYCGESILEVAKKCRHCGEWLDHPSTPVVTCPACGEENPAGTTHCQYCNELIQSDDNLEGESSLWAKLFKDANPVAILPMITALFAVVCCIEVYTSWLFIGLKDGDWHTDFGWIQLGAAAVTAVIIGMGIMYSEKFSSTEKTIATLRTWLAIGIWIAWWPLALTLYWLSYKLGIIDEPSERGYIQYLTTCFYILLVIGIVVWIIFKTRDEISLKDMAGAIALYSLVTVALIAFVVIIQFGVMSFFPSQRFI